MNLLKISDDVISQSFVLKTVEIVTVFVPNCIAVTLLNKYLFFYLLLLVKWRSNIVIKGRPAGGKYVFATAFVQQKINRSFKENGGRYQEIYCANIIIS